uniref:Uncharacterized protein n=1 Tax=Glossina brevipalpis TaxID=37001 RepID=A0A1A9WYM8_9MUSC
MNKKGSYVAVEDDIRVFIGVIGDEETTLGFLLAGVGETRTVNPNNYMIVTKDHSITDLEKFFLTLYQNSKIGIILIASELWHYLSPFYNSMPKKKLPIILDVPMKSTITTPLKLKEREIVKRKTGASVSVKSFVLISMRDKHRRFGRGKTIVVDYVEFNRVRCLN